jgi:hypothetical protein
MTHHQVVRRSRYRSSRSRCHANRLLRLQFEQPYGDAAETERGVCASEGQPANSSLSHGGYVTRCGLPE